MEQAVNLFNEIRKQLVTLITAALGFVAALIWKDAISAWLAPFYEDASGATGLTMAAIIVTVVVVIVSIIVTRIVAPKTEEKK